MRPRTVLVAHRERMVAEGIAAALARFPGIVPVAVASSAADAGERGGTMDAVALDDQLPGGDRTAASLRHKGVRVITLGSRPAERVGVEPDEDSVRVQTSASVASLAQALVPGLLSTSQRVTRLTPRERQILGLVARGLAAKQVARQLGISAKTVERHKTKMYSKLGVANQTAAVNLALTTGLVREPTWI